ncbi:MAG: glycosyltransferase [Pseudonocardiaceae bacterium]
MGVSVIVATKNKTDSLRATLACLAADPVALDGALVEVIVVDDGGGGNDATAQVAERFADRLPLRRVVGPGRGRAAARNAGAGAARRDYLLFLDDDILTAPGFLAAHLRHAGSSGFVHGPLREFPGARWWLAGHADTSDVDLATTAAAIVLGDTPSVRLFRNAVEIAILAMNAGTMVPAVEWLAAVGANLALRQTVFADVGGFDEGFGLGWGCEDLELGVRLLASGRHPRVESNAAGVHLTHSRPSRWAEHDANLARFVALHDLDSVRALPDLLDPGGGLARYVARLSGSGMERTD